MRIKLLEPLNVSHDLIDELAAPIKERGMNLSTTKKKQQMPLN